MAKKTPTWLDYLASFHQEEVTQRSNEFGENSMSLLAKHFNLQQYSCLPMMYLIDYTSGKYLMASNSSRMVLGHEPEKFLSGGVGFTIEKYHKDDLKLFNHQIFPDRLKLLRSLPPADHLNYIFSYTYRIKNKAGSYIDILQRNCILKSDPEGNPLLSLGMAVNASHGKLENPVLQTVEKINPGSSEGPETIFRKSYYRNDENLIFSEREREILLWTIEGLTSREIGKKLFISEYTVINHRRNMQSKSNTPNIAALVNFAVKNGII